MIPNKQFIDGMHIHQKDALDAFDQGKTWCFYLEWARRHRKTTLAINLLIREACTYPNAKYIYTSPYQAETRKIVWDDPTMLKNALPDKSEMDYKTNETKMLITFANGSMIQFGGTDEPDSLRGIDAIGIVCDEKALQKEVVWTEILMPVIMGELPPHLKGTGAFRWVMNLYTPKGINHATIGFDKACCLSTGGTLPDHGKAEKMKPGYFASRLDAELTDIMSPAALEIARDEAPFVIYEQEFRCKRTTQEERTLITSAMLKALNAIVWNPINAGFHETKKIISIDPAFGGDICDLKAIENNCIKDHKKEYPHKTHEIVAAAKLMAMELGTKNMIVDCIGNGKGVADLLAQDAANYNVQYFNSAEKPTDAPTSKGQDKSLFANKKAEAAYYASTVIKAQRAGVIDDPELLRQIPVATQYNINRSGQILLRSKDEVKKVLGCSPDSSDSYIQGLWGLQFVDPETEDELQMASARSGVPDHLRQY
jgi:hypothetical protein